MAEEESRPRRRRRRAIGAYGSAQSHPSRDARRAVKRADGLDQWCQRRGWTRIATDRPTSRDTGSHMGRLTELVDRVLVHHAGDQHRHRSFPCLRDGAARGGEPWTITCRTVSGLRRGRGTRLVASGLQRRPPARAPRCCQYMLETVWVLGTGTMVGPLAC